MLTEYYILFDWTILCLVVVAPPPACSSWICMLSIHSLAKEVLKLSKMTLF